MNKGRMLNGRVQCPYCNRIWYPRIKNPQSCPDCHRYFRTRKYLVIKEKDIAIKREEKNEN